ncbi:hypothetical protein N0M98_19045 [Paenibacillus doosanensis]|uniref:hypothetical protein n=1 Tax=Paenibacillus doosanensis TaxID=1229154 RepID=UPI002180650F|nr:hypothetical protein [Paenibacillus doosanensis]MCS7462241.1 hypothetical protein [Paenibacillus doosanensis]
MRQLAELILFAMTWTSLLCLGLALFRLKMTKYMPQSAISIVLLSQVSYVIQKFQLAFLVTTVQPIFFFICVWLFFRLQWIHAVVMVLLTYIMALAFEIIFNWILSGFNYSEFLIIYREQYFIQGFGVSSLSFLAVYLLRRFRWGFSFAVPAQRTRMSSMSTLTKAALAIGTLSLTSTSLSLYIWNKWIMSAYGITFFLLAVLFHLAYLKEVSE